MTREERKMTIDYLEGMKEEYIEGEGYERHPLPEWFALKYAIKVLEQEPCAIEALEQEPCTLEALELEQKPILDKIRAEIMKLQTYKMFEGEDTVYIERDDVLAIIDEYKVKSEVKEVVE